MNDRLRLYKFAAMFLLASSASAQTINNRHQRIEYLAGNESTEQSVRLLAREVLNFPSNIPLSIREQLGYILIPAEMDYVSGKNKGTTKQQLVVTYNAAIVRLQLPEYAQTDMRQLTYLQHQLAKSEPTFMADTGKLSPLQALHLLSILFSQKLTNPNYQDVGDSWQPDRYDLHHASNDRGKDLHAAIQNRTQTVSHDDFLGLLNDSFSALSLKGGSN